MLCTIVNPVLYINITDDSKNAFVVYVYYSKEDITVLGHFLLKSRVKSSNLCERWLLMFHLLELRLCFVCKTLLETRAYVAYLLLSYNILAQMCLSTHIAKKMKGFAAIISGFIHVWIAELSTQKTQKLQVSRNQRGG